MYFVRVPHIISLLLPHYKWRVDTHEIALTFDDGPNQESTPILLDILAKASCPSTHFLLGKQVQMNPELLSQISSKNHSVGHHTYTHLNGWQTASKIYIQDVQRACQLVKSSLFRPPYGKIRAKQWKNIQSLYPNMQCCEFNFMPGDFDSKVNTEILAQRMNRVRGGDIVVLHDRPECLVKYQPFLVDWIQKKKAEGYTFVKL